MSLSRVNEYLIRWCNNLANQEFIEVLQNDSSDSKMQHMRFSYGVTICNERKCILMQHKQTGYKWECPLADLTTQSTWDTLY